ncbi:MAG: F0F1 ATP synthase subunit delta [Candidatus Uhrbacteria bacterium]|nr:F0F1 ATP synthase subunit delta [Candidatus Uhrbacteria bacterium]
MAALTPKQLATVLVNLVEGKSKADAEKIVVEYANYLADNDLLTKWREIEREVPNAWRKVFGAAQVTVVSAHPLTAAARKMLEEIAPGADIVERVDQRVMAGAVVRIDDRRIDGSLAGRISKLKQELLKVG